MTPSRVPSGKGGKIDLFNKSTSCRLRQTQANHLEDTFELIKQLLSPERAAKRPQPMKQSYRGLMGFTYKG